MNNQEAYEYINSSAIREHLRKLAYPLTPIQCAFLVWQSKRHTLKQKHLAWNDIIATLPDCEVEPRQNCHGWSSLHEMLRGYMAFDEKVLSRFRMEEDNAIYECEFWEPSTFWLNSKDKPRGAEYDWTPDHKLFRSLETCFSYAMKRALEEERLFCITKRYVDTPSESSCSDPNISVEYDQFGEITDFYLIFDSDFFALTEEEEELWSESFDGMWFDIPIPFEKGDIVCDNANIYTKGIPFVLLGTVPWYKKEHPSMNGTKYCDYSDMAAYGYSFDKEQLFFNDDFRVDYLNLEYYPEPKQGPERMLAVYRQFVRGEIDGYLLLKLYRMIQAENDAERERRSLPVLWPGAFWEL